MRIFNNFDTKLKDHEYKEALQTYGKDNVLLIQRHISYWIIRGIIPFMIYCIISIITLYFNYYYLYDSLEILFWIILGIWIISSIIFLYRTIRIYIDFTMDFTIVTPTEILTHKQFGILNSDYKNFPAKKIRSVSSAREGFLGNIFGYGHILFLTDGSVGDKNEGGRHGPGKILLTYVYRPNETRKKIMLLCIGEENVHYFKIDGNNNNENKQ